MAGKINYMCFDKTGTLTEEGLDFMSVIPAVDARYVLSNSYSQSNWFFSFDKLQTEINENTPPLLTMGMMSCHSLTHIMNTISGDTLEVKIFHAAKAVIKLSNCNIYLTPHRNWKSRT